MNKPTIVPFVKWIGGKRQILKEITTRLPSTYATYHEPFLGGGALFLNILPSNAFVSDLNTELINTYKIIKNKHKILREYLLLMEYGHSPSFFQKIRNIDQNDSSNLRELHIKDSNVLRAARFIYLNKSSFNGMYRVNSKGHFNVPWGKKTTVKTHDFANLAKISSYLKNKNIEIFQASFEKILTNAKQNDFIYFDPPYDYPSELNGFDSFQKEGFGIKQQIFLAQVCKKLNGMQVKWMVSNHKTKLITDLYRGFNMSTIWAQRLIGGKGATRKKVEEVIIRNYE